MLSFRELYESYSSDVYRFALWLCGDKHDAEDITSETFVRAWSRKSAIRAETLKAYLFTIARNLYLEQQRKQKHQIALDDSYPAPTVGADRAYECKSEIERVQRVLRALPEIDRSAFVMRVQHGLPYAEIARSLELSLTSVKVKVHRVRKKLVTTRDGEEVYLP